jgi:hypothetical protein
VTGRKAELACECQAFRGTLGRRRRSASPPARRPGGQGLIEHCHDYLERSFLPGPGIASPADFNAQLQRWLKVVNARPRPALGYAPAERIAADCAAMLTLPVAPATGWRFSARLARDHYVQLDSDDYSVHPAVIGRRIEGQRRPAPVRVLCRAKVIADHERIWTRHQTLSAPGHVAAARALRRERAAGGPSRRSSSASCRSMTPRSALTGGWRDGSQDRGAGPGRRGRVLDLGAEGAHRARVGQAAGRAGPRRIMLA